MLFQIIPSFLAAATLVSLANVAFADNSNIIPCAKGAGDDNGCSGCNKDLAIALGPWYKATRVEHFDFPDAAAQVGGGYDVWWNVPQPDPTCRVLLMDPYTTDQGDIDSRLSGNVILSVAHGGCYFAHVNSRGVSAAFCCGTGDCGTANALPASKKKRDSPPSRIMRGLHLSSNERGMSELEARKWGRPAPAPPVLGCSPPNPNGPSYTKAGTQTIYGDTLSCGGGQTCSQSVSVAVTVSNTLTSEKSTSSTSTNGFSINVEKGEMMIEGPNESVTTGYSHEWSTAVSNSFSMASTNTFSKTFSIDIGLTPGPSFNLWFTPTLKCQINALNCDGVELSFEKCVASVDANGNPDGTHGVITIG